MVKILSFDEIPNDPEGERQEELAVWRGSVHTLYALHDWCQSHPDVDARQAIKAARDACHEQREAYGRRASGWLPLGDFVRQQLGRWHRRRSARR